MGDLSRFKLQKSEKVAVEDLKSLELAREVQEKEKAELDQEEVELAKEEEEFWKEYSKYLLEAAALKDKTNSLQMRLNHDARELEKLAKTNVYSVLRSYFLLHFASGLTLACEQTTLSVLARNLGSGPSMGFVSAGFLAPL